MQRVVIYQLLEKEKILYHLGFVLEKLALSNNKIGLLCDEENIEMIDNALWTFSTSYFLPHNISSYDKSVDDRQPILLAKDIEKIMDRKIICVFNNEQLGLVNKKKIGDDIIYFINSDIIEDIKTILSNDTKIDCFEKIGNKWVSKTI